MELCLQSLYGQMRFCPTLTLCKFSFILLFISYLLFFFFFTIVFFNPKKLLRYFSEILDTLVLNECRLLSEVIMNLQSSKFNHFKIIFVWQNCIAEQCVVVIFFPYPISFIGGTLRRQESFGGKVFLQVYVERSGNLLSEMTCILLRVCYHCIKNQSKSISCSSKALIL